MNLPSSPFSSDADVANDLSSLALRLGAAGLIFVVSLLASSFPSLAKRAPRIEPPLVVFFIGKHFGTGVILSTAFVHLLQEGFESFSDPCIPKGWKQWTGFIVLLSFLSIFLVEYISTVYVEHISAASSTSHSRLIADYEHDLISDPYHDDPDAERSPLAEPRVNGHTHSHMEHIDEMSDGTSSTHHVRPTTKHPGSSYRWHHRHESPCSHAHKAGPRLSHRQSLVSVFLAGREAEANARIQSGHEVEHHHGHGPNYGGHSHGVDLSHGEVSRKTRVIGILVLQLGIMIHSVVIGLTLSVTAGSDFTSLLIAIIFHQIFEGLSLGIRISSLPPGGRVTHILPIVLCILFAIAAPVGALIGIWLLPSQSHAGISNSLFQSFDDPEAGQSLMAQLGKGLMCTISAGMLIYAAAVEMLAGDFVMDPEMRQNGLGMQVLALGSLIVGVVAMGILG